MYRIFAVIGSIVFIVAIFAQANSQEIENEQQTQPAPQLLIQENLNWLLGDWQGQGTQNNRSFETTLSAKMELDGQALILERDSSGGYKELMIISYDKGSKKTVAALFTNRNNTGIFVANTMSPNKVTFSQVTSLEGYKSERTFERTSDQQIKFMIQGASQNKPLSTLVEATFTKKQ